MTDCEERQLCGPCEGTGTRITGATCPNCYGTGKRQSAPSSSPNLVARLRDFAERSENDGDNSDGWWSCPKLLREAADEIERLRDIEQRAKDGLRVGSVTCHDTSNGKMWDEATYILTGEKVNVLKR